MRFNRPDNREIAPFCGGILTPSNTRFTGPYESAPIGISAVLLARSYASAGMSRHRVSVCQSHDGIVSKRLNVGSRKQRHVIAQGL